MKADLHGAEALLARVANDAALVERGLLQPACASFFTQASHAPARGVALMLHGWSAGSWQFKPLASHLSHLAVHSFAARLPGHGACRPAGKASPHELLKSHQIATYSQFAGDLANDAAQFAQAQGIPLYVIGFSLGGALALDAALQQPVNIRRLVLVAPMLRPPTLRVQLLFGSLRSLLHLGLGPFLDNVHASWGKQPPVAKTTESSEPWVRPGHWDFAVGQLVAAVTYARGIAKQAPSLKIPTQLIVSKLDNKSDSAYAIKILKKSKATHHIWQFSAATGVGHGMLTPQENQHEQSRELLQEIVADYLLEKSGRSNL